MDETLKFEFTEDRFGFNSDDYSFGPTYARDVEVALNRLRGTIETLFGGPTVTGFRLLAEAGLLPRHPDWPAIERMLGFVSAFNRGATAREGETLWHDGEGRRVLLNLRDYLKQLESWAPVLKLGIWASLIASAGSVEGTPVARRRCGVRTVGNIFQFDLADPTQEILPRLKELARAVDTPTILSSTTAVATDFANRWAADNFEWLMLHAQGSEIIERRAPSFSEKPALLENWLTQLEGVFEDFLNLPSAANGASGAWFLVELDYWAQWGWSKDGPPKRKNWLPQVTVVDLMYTACHGGIPFVPSTGNLSIAQWSRILSEALRRDVPTQDVKNSAAGNLGVPELRSLSRTGEKLILMMPIIAVCPRSARSRASAWQPQSHIGAIAIPSRDVQDADALAARAIMGGEGTWSGLDVLGEALRGQTMGASITQVIELDDTKDIANDARAPIPIARPRISLLYFGFGKEIRAPFIPAPAGVEDLLRIARERYRDLLPSDLEGRSFWPRVEFFFRQISYWLRRSMP